MASSEDFIPTEGQDSRTEVDQSENQETSKEGKADVYLPTTVFYNPVQEFNRDLTIAVISQYAREHFKKLKNTDNAEDTKSDKAKFSEEKAVEDEEGVSVKVDYNADYEDLGLEAGKKYDDGIRVLEGLAASGLRSVRFALEVPGVKEIVTNDFNKIAVEYIKKNSKHNNVEHLITPNLGDAAMVMYENRTREKQFDVIDLDPYGSPAMFLDSAVQSVKDGGILCITCTDMAILCGNHPETCYAKYGAVSLKSKCCHELALRIVLQSIESHANRYSRYIVPLISMSVDFYVRVFVKVYTGQNKVKLSASKMSMVYQCAGCGSFALQSLATQVPTKGGHFTVHPSRGPPVAEKCEHCHHGHRLGGPMWGQPLHDCDFIDKVLGGVQRSKEKFGTASRIIGMLNMMREELEDVPLYYIVDDMCSILHCTVPTLLQIRSAILHAGYKVSLSHCAKNSIKTTAPVSVLWDLLRGWIKENPVKERHLKEGTPVKAILDQQPQVEASFELHAEANPKSREQGLLRWQMNPNRNWGPQAKACQGKKESLEERRQKGIARAKERSKRKADTMDLKQFACKRFKKGDCDKTDESCRYSHTLAQQQMQADDK